jgi:hypothetical protein
LLRSHVLIIFIAKNAHSIVAVDTGRVKIRCESQPKRFFCFYFLRGPANQLCSHYFFFFYSLPPNTCSHNPTHINFILFYLFILTLGGAVALTGLHVAPPLPAWAPKPLGVVRPPPNIYIYIYILPLWGGPAMGVARRPPDWPWEVAPTFPLAKMRWPATPFFI